MSLTSNAESMEPMKAAPGRAPEITEIFFPELPLSIPKFA